MYTPCLVISGLLFHCQQWSLGNYTENKNNDISRCINSNYYKNFTFFSFSSEGKRERMREIENERDRQRKRERIIENKEKVQTKFLCKEMWQLLLPS